ncbi:hypothetical protein ACIRBX_08555 [Kitasatospora sp. NPDC096147]|uniref:hypothetical protein n=1 Tax=Kitasatospora sp. NPDC096147 TaxID=3364093 RepID=UPI0037F6EC20
MKFEKRLWAVPVLGLTLAVGAVGCGGDDDSATAALDSWAKSVCDAAHDPIVQSKTALEDSGKVVPGEAPAELQKRLAGDLGTLAQTNQQLADAIAKAGAPKVGEGAKVQQGASDELKQAAQGYLDVQQKLTALPNEDQAKFADGLRSVSDQIQRLAQQSTDALNTLQSGELGVAISKQTGCKPSPTGSQTPGPDGGQTAGQTPSQAPSQTPGQSGAPTEGQSPSAAASGTPSTGSSETPSAAASGTPSGTPAATPSG